MVEKPASVSENIGKTKPRFFLRVGLFLALLAFASAGAFAWHSLNNPCEVDEVKQASAVLITQMRRYDDVYASAANGTRTSIDYPVTVMQQILVDTQEVEVPACMRAAKSELVAYMGDAIKAFKAFQAAESDAAIQGFLDSSYAHIRTFRLELDEIEQCAPRCFSW